jgi:hypothetical protein
MRGVRTQARQTILDHYDLRKMLPRQLEILHSVARK